MGFSVAYNNSISKSFSTALGGNALKVPLQASFGYVP
jgi:hypothetical protein